MCAGDARSRRTEGGSDAVTPRGMNPEARVGPTITLGIRIVRRLAPTDMMHRPFVPTWLRGFVPSGVTAP